MTVSAPQDFLPTLGMWLVMTALMMAPVILPWLRAVDRLARAAVPARTGTGADRVAPPRSAPLTAVPFAVGYASAWAVFSVAAAGAQAGLGAMGAPGPLLETAPTLAGSALILAGGFQLTALKDACLDHCRSPHGWLLSHWRPGVRGAVAMGLRHGLFCLGCCWALMALALVVGAMSLPGMGVLMAVMLLEILAPFGRRLARVAGIALVVGGLGLLLS